MRTSDHHGRDRRTRRAASALAGALVFVVAGCSSAPPDQAARLAFETGDFETAQVEIQLLEESDSGSAHLWRLSDSSIDLARGQAAEALESLRGARDTFKDLTPYNHDSWANPNKALEELSSLLTDDRSRTYTGRDYERLLMYAMLVLSDLLSGSGDSAAFAFQGQAELVEKIGSYEDPDGNNPKAGYHLASFGEYLRAATLEEDPTRVAEATRAYDRFLELEPGYLHREEDLARLDGTARRAAGDGALYALAFCGLAPHVQSVALDTPGTRVLSWIEFWYGFHRGYGALPYFGNVPVPALVFQKDGPTSVTVFVDGQERGSTVTVTDVDVCAQAEYEAMQDVIVFRAFLRRLVKKLLADAATRAVDRKNDDGWAALGVTLAGFAWAQMEAADTRCWSMLPSKIQALRLELPEGTHDVELVAHDSYGRVVATRSASVVVRAGYHSYLLGVFPGAPGAGGIVSSP